MSACDDDVVAPILPNKLEFQSPSPETGCLTHAVSGEGIDMEGIIAIRMP
jgi:hypothetical protein